MKLKGDKELTMERVYRYIENRLFYMSAEIIAQVAEKNERLSLLIQAQEFLKAQNVIEEISNLTTRMHIAKLVSAAILNYDFSLYEAKAIYELVVTRKEYDILIDIIERDMKNIEAYNGVRIGETISNMLRIRAEQFKSSKDDIGIASDEERKELIEQAVKQYINFSKDDEHKVDAEIHKHKLSGIVTGMGLKLYESSSEIIIKTPTSEVYLIFNKSDI